MENTPELYRYELYLHEDGVDLQLHRFKTIKETPCGYWYVEHNLPGCYLLDKRYRRWTSKTAVRRRCYPSKQEALESLKHRMQHLIFHSTVRLQKAELFLNKINDLNLEESDEINLGCIEMHKEISFP